MARRALVDARCLEAMCRPALVAACLRRFLLGDGHRRASVAAAIIVRGPLGPLYDGSLDRTPGSSSFRSGGLRMRGGSIVATNITKEYGATVVLDRVSLTVPPSARIGVVGPNGSGKSTLLRVLAGADEPSAGRVDRVGTVGYLPQEPERRDDETLLGYLARRTGVAEAEARMERGEHDSVEDFLTLGGADLERRARKV